MSDHTLIEGRWPEHDKMRPIVTKSQAIGDFIEWLGATKGIMLGEYVTDSDYEEFSSRHRPFVPAARNISRLMAEYFEIDLDLIETEKRDMLAELRQAHDRD